MNLIQNLVRPLTRKNINILTTPTHETFESGLAKTGYEFFGVLHPTVKTWNDKYRVKPKNYHLVNFLPPYLDIDVVLSQNKFGSFQLLAPVARQFQTKLISLEHTLPPPNWSKSIREQVKNMRGDINLFISDYSVERWGFSHDDPTVRVIKHGVDTDIFKPSDKVRENRVLGINNDWINRDWCCGWTQFNNTTKNLPRTILGDTPGLSEPAKDLEDLVNHYQTHRIFLNTAHVSPIPCALLEAMSSACAVVSCKTAAIPDYITHGYDGLLCETEEEMKLAIKVLMNDEAMATELGNNAAKTIREKFNLEIFTNNWKSLIESIV